MGQDTHTRQVSRGDLVDEQPCRFNESTMRNLKIPLIFASLAICAFAWPSFAQQQRVFDWQPGNQEDVWLDPANYHAGQTYHASGDGGNMQVDIKSELPVTISL